jgi:hypothetical protein
MFVKLTKYFLECDLCKCELEWTNIQKHIKEDKWCVEMKHFSLHSYLIINHNSYYALAIHMDIPM